MIKTKIWFLQNNEKFLYSLMIININFIYYTYIIIIILMRSIYEQFVDRKTEGEKNCNHNFGLNVHK